MNAGRDTGPARSSPVRPLPQPVADLTRARIERGLARRARYRYVRPWVEREGPGWKIVSPNCSRNIDPAGGPIDIAWLLPLNQGLWLLHARDHAQGCWQAQAAGLTLADALQRVCDDPLRVYWP